MKLAATSRIACDRCEEILNSRKGDYFKILVENSHTYPRRINIAHFCEKCFKIVDMGKMIQYIITESDKP